MVQNGWMHFGNYVKKNLVPSGQAGHFWPVVAGPSEGGVRRQKPIIHSEKPVSRHLPRARADTLSNGVVLNQVRGAAARPSLWRKRAVRARVSSPSTRMAGHFCSTRAMGGAAFLCVWEGGTKMQKKMKKNCEFAEKQHNNFDLVHLGWFGCLGKMGPKVVEARSWSRRMSHSVKKVAEKWCVPKCQMHIWVNLALWDTSFQERPPDT